MWGSKELGLNRFVTEQPPYHLLDRRIERELVPVAETQSPLSVASVWRLRSYPAPVPWDCWLCRRHVLHHRGLVVRCCRVLLDA